MNGFRVTYQGWEYGDWKDVGDDNGYIEFGMPRWNEILKVEWFSTFDLDFESRFDIWILIFVDEVFENPPVFHALI